MATTSANMDVTMHPTSAHHDACDKLSTDSAAVPNKDSTLDSTAASSASLSQSQSQSGCRLAAVNKFTLNPDEPKRDLQQLVEALQEELEKGKDLNRLYNIMMSYDASGNEWKRYEYWDDKKKYTRNLIAEIPDCFGLMLLCWNSEKASPIHNHAGSECFMKVLQGSIMERQYVIRGGEGDGSVDKDAMQQQQSVAENSRIPRSDIILTNEKTYTAGSCTFINDSLGVHAISNPSSERAVTLHCYIPAYDACKSWSPTAEGDGEECRVQQCHISYDTEQGERVSHD